MNELIAKILGLEWDMFTSVNNQGGRSDCQDDKATFTVMRSSQFMAWDAASQQSYLEDLKAAAAEGRNLVAEKYAHMMKYTAPDEYENIRGMITMPSFAAEALADNICRIIFEQTVQYEKEYPNIAKRGRPMSSSDDDIFTSIETYQKGELFTYSENTLSLLLRHIEAMKKAGENYPLTILAHTFKQYGFSSLDEAEAYFAKQ